MEMTIEQRRAVAMANARLRMSNSDFAAVKAEGPAPRRDASIEPDLGGVVTGLLDAFNKGTDYVGGKVTDLLAPHVPVPVAAGTGALANTALQALPMALGGGPAAKSIPFLADRMERGALLKSQNAVRDATLKAGQSEGYTVVPSEISPTWIGNQFESLAGKEALYQDATRKNALITDKLARRDIGLPEGAAISDDALGALKKAVAQPYRDVDALPGLPPPNTVTYPAGYPGQQGVRYSQYPRHGTGPAPQTPAEALHELKATRDRSFKLWEDYRRNRGVEKLDAAEALDAKALALESDIEKAAIAAGNNELVTELRAARTQYAKIKNVERATNESTGHVSAGSLGRALRNDAPLTGDLETIARFQRAFPNVMGDVERARTGGVGKLRMYGAGMLGGTGMAATGNPAGVLLAALPFIGDAARAGILSKVGQKMLANPSYPGDAATNIARLGILGTQESINVSEKEKREALIRALKQEQQ